MIKLPFYFEKQAGEVKSVNVAMLDAIFLLLSILPCSLDCSVSVTCLPHYLLFLGAQCMVQWLLAVVGQCRQDSTSAWCF